MEKKLEIKKLADVVVWADNLITAAGFNEERYKSDASTAYAHVGAHELWKIKEVVLEAMERHAVYTSALQNDIADRDAKIEKLEKEIKERKELYTALKELMDTKYIPIDEHNDICKAFEEKVETLSKELEHKKNMSDDENCVMNSLYDEIARRTEKINELTIKVANQKKNLDGINKTLDVRNKEIESLIQVRNNQTREIEAHEAENARLSDIVKNLMASNGKFREEFALKNDKIKELKEENSRLNARIKCDTEYWKNAFEAQSLDLADEKKHNKELNEVITELKEKRDKLKKELNRVYGVVFAPAHEKEDDHGRAGFKKYIEWLIEEEERAVPERFKERLNEEITEIFEKEEKTEVKGVGRTSSGRYPWGAKVNDIPCGEDSIE